ncbi:hypothetical protein CNYM01_01157 [Colletotrichum nymphaeae SA-01]|uniref:Uncharacterized protein n=1 Tax=Colletotrichum nymphaeae SA-01 TaxID=1460502 RepID=A0A135TZB3_9PEZI|nr:hypothetical protein CNYM01_01157 [Colletotrichum nymphaeae SA-01]
MSHQEFNPTTTLYRQAPLSMEASIMSLAYVVDLHNDDNEPGDHIAVWTFSKVCPESPVGDEHDLPGAKVDVWLSACHRDRTLTIEIKNDTDHTYLVYGSSMMNQSSMIAHAGSLGNGIGEPSGSYCGSLTPQFFIGIFNHAIDEDLSLENIVRDTRACKMDFAFCASVSGPTASIYVDVDGKPTATYNTTQADIVAWHAAQKRRPQSLIMAGVNTVAESSYGLQSLIDKLPGVANSINWDAPADGGKAATAEWIGSVEWPFPPTSPSTIVAVAAIASHLIARGYSLSYEACKSGSGDDCRAIIMFSFGSTGKGGHEGFDASKDWASAVGTLDQEGSSSLVNMGLLRRNPEVIESCMSKRRLSLGEFRDALNADIDASTSIANRYTML